MVRNKRSGPLIYTAVNLRIRLLPERFGSSLRHGLGLGLLWKPLEQDLRKRLVDEHKAIFAGLVFVNLGFFNIKPPAVHSELTRIDSIFDRGVGEEVLHLFEHVKLRQLIVPIEVWIERRA